MSEENKAPEKKDARTAAPGGRLARWRRRLTRIAVVVVVLALLFRLALSVLLPTVIHKTARQFGFDAGYRRLDLNLLGTQAGIWDFALRPKDRPDELIHADYAFGNISSLALFKLKLYAYRLEADGVRVNVAREADGSIPLLDQLAAAFASKQPPPAPEPLRFESPLAVEAARLNHVVVALKDDSVSPPFRQELTMNLRVSGVVNPNTPVTLDAEIFGGSMLEALRLQGEGKLQGDKAAMSVTFGLYGLHLNDAQSYLASLGVQTGDLPINLTGVADVALQAIPSRPGATRGTASVRDVRLLAGNEEAVALKEGEVQIAELSPSLLHVAKMGARGGLLRVRRTEQGLLTLASVSAARAVAPAGATTGPATETSTAPAASVVRAPATAPGAVSAGMPFRWRLDELIAADLAAEFRDQLYAPERRVGAKVQTFEVKNVASNGAADDVATLKLVLAVPGVADSLRVDGRAKPFADSPGAAVTFDVSGIRPEALRPYLAPLGIDPTLQAGRFRATLEASVADLAGPSPKFAFSLRDVQLDDGGRGLVKLDSVSISGLQRDPATGAIDVGEIVAAGPSLTVRRIDDRTLEFPGLRYHAMATTQSAATQPAATVTVAAQNAVTHPPAPAGAGTAPIVRVDKLTWGKANVRLDDPSIAGSEPIDLSDAGLEVTGFVLDLRPDAPPSPPGKITGRFRSPGLAESVTVDGTVTPGNGSLATDLTVAGTGLNLQRLAPYLKPLGIAARMEQGSLKASARASVTQSGETLRLAGGVRDAELSDHDTRLVAVERAEVDRVDVSAAGFDVGDVTISRSYVRVERDADGGFAAAGIKFLPAAPTTQPATATAQQVAATARTAAAATAPAGAATQPARADPFAILAALPPFALKSLKVESAQIDWLDRASPKPVEVAVKADASVQSVALNQPRPQTARYELVVSSSNLADRVRIAGTLEPKANALSLAADVEATGLRPAALAPYLPTGVEPALKSGAFKTAASVSLARRGDGSLRGDVKVDGLALHGGEDAAPLAALESVNVTLDRFDAASGDVALSQVSVVGVEGSAVRDADGATRLLGLRVAPSAAPAPSPAAQAPAPMPAAAAAPADLQAIVAQSKETLPLLALEALDVRVKRLSFEDRLRKAEPVALADFRLANDGPIRLLGPKPGANPPVKLTLSGALDPVVKQFNVTAQAAPFAERPAAKVAVDAEGIDGDGLMRIAPELAQFLDGKGLTDGRFKTALEAEANVRRRGPTQIDLSRGMEVTFSLTGTALRAGESGPVLAGVGSVHGEQVRIETRTGDVTVRSLEVTDLAANAWREADGIHVLGMRIKGTEVKPAEVPPAAPAPEAEARIASHSEAAAASVAGEAAGKPEMRIDRLAVSGLDFRFEDRALDPPVLIPINALDADVRGLSSLALEKERPLRFNVSLGAGKVSLPKKLRGGMLSGALGDIGKLAGGKQVESAPEAEDRDFFAQVVAAGNVKLYPKPAGRAQASVNGVELAAIRGLAASSGIGLNGGTFDGRIEMKTRDDEKLDVRSRFVLTDLSVSEPANGPIVRYLSLPAPLDVVIGAAEAPDKSITLPLHFQVDGASPEGIAPAAVGAVGQVLVTAVASAPVKAVSGVVGLFGDGAKEMEVVQDPPVYLTLSPGVVSLDAQSQRTLSAVLARTRRDKNLRVVIEHELGQDDVEVAALRANPPAQQVAVLAENLRSRRREIIRLRDELLMPARAAALHAGAGGAAPAAALTTYRELHGELAGVEDALDHVYDLQRPGAAREADRRTRAAAIEIADARLAAARAAVQALGNPAAERIRVGTARFAPPREGSSRLVIVVARLVAKSKHRGAT